MEPTNQPNNLVVHQLVVKLPTEKLVWLNEYLTEHTERWLSRQHPADEEVETTHTHYMIVNPKVHKNSTTKHLNKNGVQTSKMFGYLTVTEKTKKPYKEEKLGCYIMKGKQIGEPDMPIYSHNYDERTIKEYIADWRDYGKVTPIEKDLKLEEGHENLPKLELQFANMLLLAEVHFKNTQITLSDVRKWTFKQMLSKQGLPPQSSTYKRFVCGIYYKLKPYGHEGCSASPMEEILEFAY